MAKNITKLELPEVQAALRDLWKEVDAYLKDEVDFGKRRKITKAIDGTHPEDYVTLAQLNKAIAGAKPVDKPVAPVLYPACRVYNSAAISIDNATLTALTFNSERYDTDAMHSTSSNTGRITFNTPGIYNVGACIEFSTSSSTALQCRIRLNGATVIVMVTDDGGGGADQKRVNPSCSYNFASSDYIEVVVYQNSGSALNINAAGNYSPEFWAQWQAPTP